MNQTPDLVSR